MDKVPSQDGAMAPAQGSLMLSPPYEVRHTLSCRVQMGHLIQAQTSFLWLYQSPPDVGTSAYVLFHAHFLHLYLQRPTEYFTRSLGCTDWVQAIPSTENWTRVGTDTAGRRLLAVALQWQDTGAMQRSQCPHRAERCNLTCCSWKLQPYLCEGHGGDMETKLPRKYLGCLT